MLWSYNDILLLLSFVFPIVSFGACIQEIILVKQSLNDAQREYYLGAAMNGSCEKAVIIKKYLDGCKGLRNVVWSWQVS